MDVGSIIWFRQPADAPARARRNTAVAGAATATHEDSWRPWHKGKITKATPSDTGTTYTVDKIHEDGETSGQTFDVHAEGGDSSTRASAEMSEIELANVMGQASVETSSEVEDLTVLTHLHEPEILHALQLRYDRDLIYTATGPILIALNPFKTLNIYEKEQMVLYAKAGAAGAKGLSTSFGSALPPPHPYAIADRAFRNMTTVKKKDAAAAQGSNRKSNSGSSGVQNQTILVSGESGAGKTETTKIIMKYLAQVGEMETDGDVPAAAAAAAAVESSSSDQCSVSASMIKPQDKVLRSNPVLEAFGNARTVRNDNSSRFGKFIELQFDVTKLANNRFATSAADVPLIGASVRTYLLEKVRVVNQSTNERNFHIFYLLGCGGSDMQRSGWYMGDENDQDAWRDMAYLNQSECWERKDGVSDDHEFEGMVAAMEAMGFEESEQVAVLRATAAVLQLGDIEFDAAGEDATVVTSSSSSSSQPQGIEGRSRSSSSAEVVGSGPLNHASSLLAVAPENLQRALTSRRITTPEGSVEVNLKPEQATHAKDAMAKMIYGEIFEWVVSRVNVSIQVNESGTASSGSNKSSASSVSKLAKARNTGPQLAFIGVLDIFGFESFLVNSFEQLCINYCNETLQQQFNGFVLKREQEEYVAEAILYNFVSFRDSTACLELIEMKRTGIFATLQEQCLFPKATDASFASKLYSNCTDHECFHADFHVKAVNGFVVIHYAGPVCYSTAGFLEKNMDSLSPEAGELLASSSDAFVSNLQSNQVARNLAAATAAEASAAARGGGAGGSRRGTTSGGGLNQGGLGYKFMASLVELNSLIATTGPHYVRCLKPNSLNQSEDFDPKLLSGQLKCNGVLEAVKVTRSGFSNRFPHRDFLKTFAVLDDSSSSTSTSTSTRAKLPTVPKDACAALLARVLSEGENTSFSFPATNTELQTLGVQVGKSKVFLRQSAYEQLERLRNAKLRGAATVISTRQRGRAAKKAYVATLRGTAVVQRAVRILRAKRILAQKQLHVRSAVKLQAHWRKLQSKLWVQTLRRTRAASRLSSWVRALKPRRSFKKMRRAAVACQSRRRLKAAVKLAIEKRRAAKDLGNVQVERDELRVSLGEAKKRIKELAGELKARTLERDEALAAASANSGGNGAAHASSSPVAASYASSTSPIVPGVNRRRSNDNDGDDSPEEGSRRTSAAASLFRDVGLDSSDGDSNEEANRPPSTRTGGGGGDDRIEELEELVAAAEAQARQASVFLADSKAESARANSDAAQLKVDLQRWKGEAQASIVRAEAAAAKATEAETMLQEWQQLKARVSDSASGPQLSAEEAQLMAAMAVKEKEVALERASADAAKALTLAEETETLKQAMEVSEEAAHQERRRVEVLDRKCHAMAEAHTNALAEQADTIAALRKKNGHSDGNGNDSNGRAEALEAEVLELRNRLAGLQEALAQSSGGDSNNGASVGAQHDGTNGAGSGSVGSQGASSSSSSALSVLAAGHLADLDRCRRQLQEALEREITLAQEKEASETRCSQLKGQWQGAQREAAALGAERDLALRHSQQMEAMLETWRNVPTPSSSGSDAMAQVDEATAAALTARVEGLAALNGSLSAELSETRAELNESRSASGKHQAAVVAAEAHVASAKAEGDSLRNRLTGVNSELALAESDRSSLRERLKSTTEAMHAQAQSFEDMLEECRQALLESKMASNLTGGSSGDAAVANALASAEAVLAGRLEERANALIQSSHAEVAAVEAAAESSAQADLKHAQERATAAEEDARIRVEAVQNEATTAAAAAAEALANAEAKAAGALAEGNALKAKLEASQQRLLNLFTQSSISGGGDGDDSVAMCVDALKSVFSKELNGQSQGSILSSVMEEGDEDDDDDDDDEGATRSNYSGGMVAFPGSPGGLSPTKAKKKGAPPQHPLEEHGQLLAELRRIVDGQMAKQRSENAELERRLIASQDALEVLEGTVKKVRATSARRQSLDASHDDTLSMHAGNTSSTTSSEVTVLRPGVAAFLDAHGVGPGGATRSGGVQEVDPVVLLVCRPAPGEDVMAGLLALESEGYDLNAPIGGERPIHLLVAHAQYHSPKVVLAALKLFLAFADANDCRADGATALHICLAEQQEHAWFLAPPLVAAGADLNAPWHRPLPNWAEVIDENTSRTYWYNEHTGESLWTMPEDPSPTIPSVLAATLAADPPLNLRDVSESAVSGGLSSVAVDSLLDDMLAAICAPQSWIPDEYADECMSCDKEFGFLTRRHHCRHCGRVVCKQCQRDMKGMMPWATQALDGSGTVDDRQSVYEPSNSRNSSPGNRLNDEDLADTIKVCRQCAAAHYRSTMRRPLGY